MFWLFLAGCDEPLGSVQFSGMVQDAPGNLGGAVEGATVTAQNRSGEVTGTDETDADGAFSVTVGAGVSMFITVAASGYVTTSFSGLAGTEDFDADTGYPWIATEDWVATQRAFFDGCPNATTEGTMVLGQSLVYVPNSNDPGSWPALSGVEIHVLGSDGVTYSACYLDDDNVSAPTATSTGGTGSYAVFGVPAGGIDVTADAIRGNGEMGTDVFEFIAPEGGLIPIFPTAIAI